MDPCRHYTPRAVLDLCSLNPQQRLAVETLDGPVLILAGAGTGKTRVITYRVAHLIERGVAPAHILGVTFTNKAAREMQERVDRLVPRRRAADANARPTLCTFHSLGARLLRQHIDKLGYKRNFVIYTESDQLGAVKKILSQVSARGVKVDAVKIQAWISRFKNNGAGSSSGAAGDDSALARHLLPRYDSALRACNAVDFDDLLLLTLRLFREHPEVLDTCRQRYRYVMVDEYQDTNAVQFQIAYHLVARHQNLCVVGDDDQSIYSWRGAEVAHLLDMEKHFPRVKVIKLEQNYRSTNTILRAANALIQHNARRRPKQLWSQRGDGAKITLHTFPHEDAEARAIVEEIEFRRGVRRIPWSRQAVLFRTNLQARPLETAFRQANVRYHLVGGQSYFDRREVKDFLAWLKTLLNPHDDISLLRIANVPARGLSDATLERLLAASAERKCSVFTAMKNAEVQAAFSPRTRDHIEGFVRLVEQSRAKLTATAPAPGSGLTARPQAWAHSFLAEIGYLEDLRRSEKNAETAESRVRNVKELLASLDDTPAPGSLADRLQAFLEAITLDTERELESDTAGDAVTLITMHSCKGLEFPHVYIVGAEDGLIPHARSREENTLDEERRLFYVALTRAIKTLDISHCAGRKKYGQLTSCRPSPFLKDLPANLVEHAAARPNEPVSNDDAKALFAQMRAAAG